MDDGTPAGRDRHARIAARRTPVEEGVSAIEAFAKTLGVGKDVTLTLIFAGRIATIDAERSRIIAGIKRYSKRQRRLADWIRDPGAGLTRRFHQGNGICGEQCLSKAVCEAESHSHGSRFGAPIRINRAGAKSFNRGGYKTPLFEKRTKPLK